MEKAVSFQIPFLSDEQAEVVHSLAKWKRMVLDSYGYHPGEGIYTDMRAIRAEEELDPIHSLYVDQRDWEKIITQEQRTLDTLKATITKIYQALLATEELLTKSFPQLKPFLAKELYFISAQELADRYPELTAKERETAICREYGSVFVMQIGMPLSSGLPHEKRAPDYDDWLLNGDLLVYYPPLKQAVELSSMGIRVDAERLLHQRALRHPDKKLDAPYHQMIVDGVLPYTIGGGIGQSRVVMLLLHKLHIGEVQVSLRGKEIET